VVWTGKTKGCGEIIYKYNLCKTFHCLPSQIEDEEKYLMDAFIYLEIEVDKKQEHERKTAEMRAKHG